MHLGVKVGDSPSPGTKAPSPAFVPETIPFFTSSAEEKTPEERAQAEIPSKFKLKPKQIFQGSNSPVAPSSAFPAPNPGAETPATVPVPEVSEKQEPKTEEAEPEHELDSQVSEHKVPHIRAPESELPLAEAPIPVDPTKKKAFKIGLGISILLFVLLCLAAVLLAWRMFRSEAPAPVQKQSISKSFSSSPAHAPETKTAPTTTPKPEHAPLPAQTPTPVATSPNVSAVPESSLRAPIDRTNRVVEKRVQNEVTSVNAIVEGERPAPAVPSPVPAAPAAEAAHIPPPSAQPALPPQASAAFRRFVSEMVILGVYQGSPARAIINGRTLAEGQLVDKPLGIVFQGINAEKKTITFKDASGASITRKY